MAKTSPAGPGRLPNFLIIGAQKAGTSSLYEYLRHHPQVFMSTPKELDFFVKTFAWHRGTAWYASQFAGAGDAVAVGEASPSYSAHPSLPGVPERIKATVPSVRLVYLMRHPLERMQSGYLHALSRGQERRSIAEALTPDSPYVQLSSYAMQIERYLTHFDRSQLLVLLAEDLRSNRRKTLERVLEFLGLGVAWAPPNLTVEYHQSADKRAPRNWALALGEVLVRAHRRLGAREERPWPVPARLQRLLTRPIDASEVAIGPGLRRHLEDLIRPDVERLRCYLGPDFGGWGLL